MGFQTLFKFVKCYVVHVEEGPGAEDTRIETPAEGAWGGAHFHIFIAKFVHFCSLLGGFCIF